MIDDEEQLIYVGKSKCLRDRLLSYFAAGAEEQKSGHIVARSMRIVWEQAPHELAALLRELELIRRWQPKYNVQGRPGRLRRGYLCLGRGPAAYAYLAAQPSADNLAAFGPISVGSRTREAVRRLNDAFLLRECPRRVPMIFADQRELFPQQRVAKCMRLELGICLGPCAAACSRAEYTTKLREARDFLAGDNVLLLKQLEERMLAAGKAQEFERAANLRDIWAELVWLREQLGRLAEARQQYSFVYTLPGYCGKPCWYLVRAGLIHGVVKRPTGHRSAAHCLRRLEQLFPQQSGPPASCLVEDAEMLGLMSTWFRKNPAELEKTQHVDQARQWCAARLDASVSLGRKRIAEV